MLIFDDWLSKIYDFIFDFIFTLWVDGLESCYEDTLMYKSPFYNFTLLIVSMHKHKTKTVRYKDFVNAFIYIIYYLRAL